MEVEFTTMATGDSWARLSSLVHLPMQAGLDANRGNPIMFLLPLAGAARLFHWNAAIVLAVNLVAIVFLSDTISSASDELADSLGHLQGALIGATLGNTVELTVGITALNRLGIVLTDCLVGYSRSFARGYRFRSICYGWEYFVRHLTGRNANPRYMQLQLRLTYWIRYSDFAS